MGITIRQAGRADATQWLDLLQAVVGRDYPDRRVYELEWIASQLDPDSGHETWVADGGAQFQAAMTLLAPTRQNVNPIINLGRNLVRPEGIQDGSASELMKQINALADQRGLSSVARVRAADVDQQVLFESAGYSCVGFQPAKHVVHGREGILFFVRLGRPDAVVRLPISETLPQVAELASCVLSRLKINAPHPLRDGATGYPLQSELRFHDTPFDDFELWRMQATATELPEGISSGYNQGVGLLRLESTGVPLALLGQREDQMVAGLAYFFDEDDRCLRIVDSFAADDISLGAVLREMVTLAQTRFNAVYVEADIPMTAPRLLKSAEQLGFIPVAYLPAFCNKNGQCADVVKMVKLGLLHTVLTCKLTDQARTIVGVIERNFEDQKAGLAVILLLRSLPIFNGLGEGELRKVAQLCEQKLARSGETVFRKGEMSTEAYVVMRGQVDIHLAEGAAPVASLSTGQIFGEQAFLDGSAREASAMVSQPTALLVIRRVAFNDLLQREPRLGMVIMRNTALDLSHKLRNANALLRQMKRGAL